MMSVSDGARRDVLRQVEQLGVNNIIVRNRGFGGSTGLGLDDAGLVRELVPQVVAVSPLVETVGVVSGPVAIRNASFLGVTPEYGQVLDLQIGRGRFLTALDARLDAPVCVLGEQISRALFGYRDPLGEQLQVDRYWCQVVGVLAERSTDARAVGALGARDLNQVVIGSIGWALATSPTVDPGQPIHEVWIRVADGGRVSDIAGTIEYTLAQAHGGETDLDVVVPRELLNQRLRTQQTFNVVVGSVAVLSLLVGGIGIMNIMLTTVLERTREIGLRRVVGATPRDIVLQFLTESLIMTMAGGGIGIATGVVTSYAITAYAQWSTWVSMLSIVLAFGV